MENKKMIIAIVVIVLASFIATNSRKDKETEVQEQEEVIEEVIEQEENEYVVELNDVQISLLERYDIETLKNYQLDGNTYTISKDDKEQILKELDEAFQEDLKVIREGNFYLDDLYNSKDYQLFRVYFYDTDDFDTFTQNYLKYCFEIGDMYKKFDGHNAIVNAIYYKNGSDEKLKTYSSLMLDLDN